MNQFIAFHRKHGAQLEEIDGAGLPIRYGNKLEEEVETLLEGAAIFDASSFLLISVNGPDAGDFLQGMVTSDVKALEMGQAQPSLLCGNRGKIEHCLEILRISETEWVVCCAPGDGISVGRKIDQFHIREEMELTVLNSRKIRIDLIGPKSLELLKTLGHEPGIQAWYFQGHEAFSISAPLMELPRLINLMPIETVLEFIHILIEAPGTGLIGLDALCDVTTHLGLPRFGRDYGNENFPQEASLGDHISYSKGCYIGQESHARMYHRGHPNWLLVKLLVPDTAQPPPGAEVYQDGKMAGHLTSLSSIKQEGFRNGIGMIRHQQSQAGEALALDSEGSLSISQFPLPYSI